MKCSFLAICLFSSGIATAQQIIKKELVYGKATDWHNKLTELKLDVFYPANDRKLPLVVFLHGGGFMEGGSREFLTPFCERLSKSGFVVANLDYRTGYEQSEQNYRSEIAKAVYRAQQDEIAAVRFLVHSANEFSIDTSLIFIGGESAGGVASLFTGYVSQEDWDKEINSLHTSLGSVDDSGNEFHDHFTIKGVISLWGGISDTSFISPHDMLKTPVLLAHSMDDAEIPFERASHKEAKQTLLLGSKDIARRFDTNGGCYQLYFVKEAGHGYGFSSDYISNAVKNFADGIREGKCKKLEIENRERNIAISLVDSDEALFPDEDNRIIKLAAEKLQEYAGKYNNQGYTVIMTVEGDHLKVQPPGPQSFDLYPLSENIFLDKLHNFRIEFVRDPDGRVKEHIYRPTRFKAFNFKKIK